MTSPGVSAKVITPAPPFDWKRLVFIGLGLAAFALFYFLPPLAPAVDPSGQSFALSREAQLAIGLFLLAGIWWVFEVIPIGVTSISIGVIQAMFFIRPASDAFRDFMDPSVMFILGSLMLGLAFTKAGLTKRLAFKMLTIVGENTRMILLGSFVVTAALTHFMAHTAVAATMFPLLMIILSLYGKEEIPTNFGRGLFIGMAYAAGAGSMCTMLGAARSPVAAGFYQEFTGQTLTFLQLSKAMAPFGWIMVFIIWALIAFVFFKPEDATIPGLREKATKLYSELGPITRQEIFVCVVALVIIMVLALQNFIPALQNLNRSVPLLAAAILFFLTRLFVVDDLEKRIPWNIVLLFSGAMSIGFALWQTGAAQWMAVHWLSMFQDVPWLIFVIAIAFLVVTLTNFIMNVAAIAITLPVALVIAEYLGVNPDLILYTALAMAALPFMLLVGAAPNAIAYQSKQFTTGQFFIVGIPFSLVALLLVGLFALTVWPLLGIPALLR
ncbi:MAG: SLC13/DASS family transporter [Desulforudis sp.]|jgi:sodium-dependent dicarboxylate transporter 2/3/5|nr:SLC13 family permease [Clostridia bacterium]RJX19953.1 MAG: SLC13/DASS family transporter [Desulforudis sp.]